MLSDPNPKTSQKTKMKVEEKKVSLYWNYKNEGGGSGGNEFWAKQKVSYNFKSHSNKMWKENMIILLI
jgi:hypothetical protein